MDVGALVEMTRLGLFISCNLDTMPCMDPHNMLVTLINPKETLKLAYQTSRDEFKKFITEEYQMHKDYFNSRL